MRQNAIYMKGSRIAAFLMCMVMMFTAMMTTAYATPDTDTQPTAVGWVNLKCTVPEGYTGEVSIILMDEETGDSYNLTGHRVNDYTNSMDVPVGEYYVRAFTSEGNFVYEAISDVDTVTVAESHAQTVNVKVLYNGNPEDLLPEEEIPVTTEPEEPETEEPVEPETPEVTPEEPEQETEVPEEPVDEEPVPEEEPEAPVEEPKEEKSGIRGLLMDIASLLMSGLIFAALVYGCCWLYKSYKENNQ